MQLKQSHKHRRQTLDGQSRKREEQIQLPNGKQAKEGLHQVFSQTSLLDKRKENQNNTKRIPPKLKQKQISSTTLNTRWVSQSNTDGEIEMDIDVSLDQEKDQGKDEGVVDLVQKQEFEQQVDQDNEQDDEVKQNIILNLEKETSQKMTQDDIYEGNTDLELEDRRVSSLSQDEFHRRDKYSLNRNRAENASVDNPLQHRDNIQQFYQQRYHHHHHHHHHHHSNQRQVVNNNNYIEHNNQNHQHAHNQRTRSYYKDRIYYDYNMGENIVHEHHAKTLRHIHTPTTTISSPSEIVQYHDTLKRTGLVQSPLQKQPQTKQELNEAEKLNILSPKAEVPNQMIQNSQQKEEQLSLEQTGSHSFVTLNEMVNKNDSVDPERNSEMIPGFPKIKSPENMSKKMKKKHQLQIFTPNSLKRLKHPLKSDEEQQNQNDQIQQIISKLPLSAKETRENESKVKSDLQFRVNSPLNPQLIVKQKKDAITRFYSPPLDDVEPWSDTQEPQTADHDHHSFPRNRRVHHYAATEYAHKKSSSHSNSKQNLPQLNGANDQIHYSLRLLDSIVPISPPSDRLTGFSTIIPVSHPHVVSGPNTPHQQLKPQQQNIIVNHQKSQLAIEEKAFETKPQSFSFYSIPLRQFHSLDLAQKEGFQPAATSPAHYQRISTLLSSSSQTASDSFQNSDDNSQTNTYDLLNINMDTFPSLDTDIPIDNNTQETQTGSEEPQNIISELKPSDEHQIESPEQKDDNLEFKDEVLQNNQPKQMGNNI
ncbi:MAG: hypothetical protein EZS28_026528 [Streblomastix strix]|uniref:Uncharacterized protein n=1 Tax=Streblomastix strix TaxID=222440 RepID=A0A5J4V4V4_9EUKA|nr:MAG: hypothetical protein EZS28_026528 [Streblomastix strix]